MLNAPMVPVLAPTGVQEYLDLGLLSVFGERGGDRGGCRPVPAFVLATGLNDHSPIRIIAFHIPARSVVDKGNRAQFDLHRTGEFVALDTRDGGAGEAWS